MPELMERKKIGDFMVEKGLILREWVDEILVYAKKNQLLFGEASVALGYITESDLRKVLLTPYQKQAFFRLNPRYFPTVTRDLIPVADMIEFGAIPLGYKNEFRWFRSVPRLNLGLISPDRQDSVVYAREKVPTVKSIKVFQVLPDEYLTTLQAIYGVGREAVKQSVKIDHGLSLYLQLDRRQKSRVPGGGSV